MRTRGFASLGWAPGSGVAGSVFLHVKFEEERGLLMSADRHLTSVEEMASAAVAEKPACSSCLSGWFRVGTHTVLASLLRAGVCLVESAPAKERNTR